MATKKQKYYVVWEGVKPGIYDNWRECQIQIKGIPGAKYKSFTSLHDAKSAYSGNYYDAIDKKTTKKINKLSESERSRILWNSLSVDAACSGSPGIMEYRGVWTKSAEHVFHQGPFPLGTNNVGEFLALIHGLAYLQKIGENSMPIYTDSRTAMSWLRNKKVKTTLVHNEKTKQLHELVRRGLNWLDNNTYNNPVIKWETEVWGEIPADFGRK